MDRQPDHAGYPQVHASFIIRELILAGATEEELIATAMSYAVGGKTVERVIITALDHYLPEDVRLREQIRWYRRAVNDNQVWAMYEGGTLWSMFGSDDSIPIGPIDHVSAEEARQWIAQAADHGLRRACLEAACWHLDDERAAGWLRTAFGAGDQDTWSRQHEPALIALWLARALDKVGDPEAGKWYRTAVERPPWSVSDNHGASWVEAVSEYALWAHRQGNEGLCTALAYRLLEDAADNGPDDRRYLDSEYKTYRYDWQKAWDAEFARHQIMRHLLTEHELPSWQKMEIALLLTNDRRFGQETWGVVQAALDPQIMKSLTLRRFVTGGMARHVHVPHVPIKSEHAWAMISWLLEDVVPAVFRFVGLDQTATDFARLVPADFRRASYMEWRSEVMSILRGKEFAQPFIILTRDERDNFNSTSPRLVDDAVNQAGLGERRSLFKSSELDDQENFVDLDLTISRWVLLRGDPAWLGMYCATAAEGTADEWMDWWSDASEIVVTTLMGALLILGHELNTDWTAKIAFNDPIAVRWRELGETLERKTALFLERAGAL